MAKPSLRFLYPAADFVASDVPASRPRPGGLVRGPLGEKPQQAAPRGSQTAVAPAEVQGCQSTSPGGRHLKTWTTRRRRTRPRPKRPATMPAGSRRPSLEQLITTHQSTWKPSSRRRSGSRAPTPRRPRPASTDLRAHREDEPLTQDKVGAFVQQLGIVLPPAQLDTLFAFFAVSMPNFRQKQTRKEEGRVHDGGRVSTTRKSRRPKW